MTRARLAVVVGALAALLLGWFLRPAAHPLPETHHGDADLARQARELTDGLPSALAVGVVSDEGIRTATIGAPLEGTFEIGSITKGITGMLYTDAVERGEIEPATTLGEVLGLGGVPAADVTLQQLSRHRSGLPRVAGGIGSFLRGFWATLTAQNPYTGDVAETLAHLGRVGTDGEVPSYSNFGFAVLGHALAERAGTTYPDLVAERVTAALGLGSMRIPDSPADLTDRAVTGRDTAGREQEPWTGHATAPAGGIRADIGDMTRLAQALLEGLAPGVAALDPVADFDDDRIGAGWITSEHDDRTITWHNGGTGGFRSWLGMDREAGVAVVLLAATTHDVDDAARELLLREVGQR